MFYKSDGIPKNSDLNVRFPSYIHHLFTYFFYSLLSPKDKESCILSQSTAVSSKLDKFLFELSKN